MACLNQTECGEGSPDERIGLSYLIFALRGAMREPTRSAADPIGSPWVGMLYPTTVGCMRVSRLSEGSVSMLICSILGKLV
jgi:hypothetical protein